MKLCELQSILPISGIGSISTAATRVPPVTMSSRFNDFETIVEIHVSSTITKNFPTDSVARNNLNMPDDVLQKLADPQFDKPLPIDFLIGADLFFELFMGISVAIGERSFACDTRLGWIITGHLPVLQFGQDGNVHATSGLSLKSKSVALLLSQ